jgi:hypothetical protein
MGNTMVGDTLEDFVRTTGTGGPRKTRSVVVTVFIIIIVIAVSFSAAKKFSRCCAVEFPLVN